MAIYTYEVDHGDNEPRIHAGMEINGGRVTAVQFGAALQELERLQDGDNSNVPDMGLQSIELQNGIKNAKT